MPLVALAKVGNDPAGQHGDTIDLGQVITTPSVQQLRPATGPATGGTMSRITGAFFLPGIQFLYGDKPAPRAQTFSFDTAVAVSPAATNGLVVDVTAKAPSAFADAVGLARPGGTIVVAGTRGGGGAPRFEPDLLVYKELHVVGALGVEYPAYRAALEILAMGRWPFDRITRESTGFAGLAQLLTSLADESARSSGALHNVFLPTP